jgi:hypothetical protein
MEVEESQTRPICIIHWHHSARRWHLRTLTTLYEKTFPSHFLLIIHSISPSHRKRKHRQGVQAAFGLKAFFFCFFRVALIWGQGLRLFLISHHFLCHKRSTSMRRNDDCVELQQKKEAIHFMASACISTSEWLAEGSRGGRGRRRLTHSPNIM